MGRDKDHIEAKEQEHLSGAYIRSLVKHLTSKDSSDGSENGECFNDVSSNTPKQQPPPQHKKQVRRRLHTTKPYQERLLNMAEARREIVTALKFHRASMKQQEEAAAAATAAAGNHHRSPPQCLGQERKPKSRPTFSLYPPTTATATTANSYWPMSTFAPPSLPPPLPPPSYHDNHNLVLPSQPLGLNLNFQSFTNLDTNIYHKPLSNYSSSSTSSSTSSSSPALSAPVMEDIRSIGDQHQIEWNDTINLVTSARWCNYLKTMDIEANEDDDYDHGFHQFDQNMEFPPWLINGNESSCLQQHFDDDFSNGYFQDPALPCMDIGEIEAMDGEWLA
ncbi:hypothetical protein HanPSC8_Chr03g0094411 [Helianthus annuus]|nr:hypothetical protein HanPSC8_Chr03g0094411 [Helianthus annuus]